MRAGFDVRVGEDAKKDTRNIYAEMAGMIRKLTCWIKLKA